MTNASVCVFVCDYGASSHFYVLYIRTIDTQDPLFSLPRCSPAVSLSLCWALLPVSERLSEVNNMCFITSTPILLLLYGPLLSLGYFFFYYAPTT